MLPASHIWRNSHHTRLDVGVVERPVGVVGVEPHADALGERLEVGDVALHRLAAQPVELADAEGLDLVLVVDAELLLDLDLDREAVAVPAALAGHVPPPHGVEPGVDVLEEPGPHVVDAGPAVGGGRALVEDPLGCAARAGAGSRANTSSVSHRVEHRSSSATRSSEGATGSKGTPGSYRRPGDRPGAEIGPLPPRHRRVRIGSGTTHGDQVRCAGLDVPLQSGARSSGEVMARAAAPKKTPRSPPPTAAPAKKAAARRRRTSGARRWPRSSPAKSRTAAKKAAPAKKAPVSARQEGRAGEEGRGPEEGAGQEGGARPRRPPGQEGRRRRRRRRPRQGRNRRRSPPASPPRSSARCRGSR